MANQTTIDYAECDYKTGVRVERNGFDDDSGMRLWDTTEIYSHLDIDAYYSPYQSLEHAIRNSQLTDPFTVALTDGTRQSRVREHHVYRFATHSAHRDPTQSRHQDCRWDAIVAAWIPTLGVEIIDTRATGSKWMRYQFYKMRRQQNDNRSY